MEYFIFPDGLQPPDLIRGFSLIIAYGPRL